MKVIQISNDKSFSDYNDYHDRGFMKWITAFNMAELANSISKNTAEATKEIPTLPLMSEEEISDVLQEAMENNVLLSIQLNTRDEFGRQTESIIGKFNGQKNDEILIDSTWYFISDIRNIHFVENWKWSKI
ncbi:MULTISPECIES: hypothetical protein [unclassified Enterococcus]|uniref:hypothetical protein n=1 Tax=unclassified Enterococcus TaxID=2608891 RepID=UPI0024760BCF|nr:MULTISPECIES: hypothetical protein [unclassified Enterococcus]